MLILTAFVSPLFEFFDRWDLPGPGNDTEMAVFCLMFALCLVLLVCKLISALAGQVSWVSTRVPVWDQFVLMLELLISKSIFVPPQLSPTLRI